MIRLCILLGYRPIKKYLDAWIIEILRGGGNFCCGSAFLFRKSDIRKVDLVAWTDGATKKKWSFPNLLTVTMLLFAKLFWSSLY